MVSPFNKRNVFNRSRKNLLTCEMGKLIPVLCEQVVPGDTYRGSTASFIRFAPTLAPIMHDIYCYIHYWFVPLRLVWDNWEDFITGGQDGQNASVLPKISFTNVQPGDLADYFGVPTGVTNALSCNALKYRAYNLIYNEWYRDENLINEVAISKADGTDTTTNTTLLSRAWAHDTFTSALPWTQRGPAVTVPLGSSAPVFSLSNATTGSLTTGIYAYNADGTINTSTNGQAMFKSTTGLLQLKDQSPAGDAAGNLRLALRADLTQATSATINDWRLAFQIQRFLEKNARGGARYIEWLMSHFGVRCSDARLQRPEYLGGGKTNVVVSEVLQTSATDNVTPQGNMAGHMFTAGKTPSFTKSFEEYGYIIGIMSIMPRTMYMQGQPKDDLYRSRYDYYLPVLAHLGEQPVYNAELYAQGTSADMQPFGYMPNYYEYRHAPSTVHGQFRTTLDFWHLARKFTNLPTLSSQFINADPTTRIFAVTDPTYNHVYCELYHHIKAIRPIPKHGTPGYIDHD